MTADQALQEAKARLERALYLDSGLASFGHTDEVWGMLWLAYSNVLLVEEARK